MNLLYKAVIKVNETLPTWGFTIDKIIFNGKKYNISLPAIISTASDVLFISDDLYELFRDSILKEAIEQGICHLHQTHAYQYIDNFETILRFDVLEW